MIKRNEDNHRYRIKNERKVFVNKNLHKNCWSIKQDGLVKAHAEDLSMWDCSFRVNQKGREKVLNEKRKNVHAGVIGYLDVKTRTLDYRNPLSREYKLAMYNPYKYKSFVRVEDDSKPVIWSYATRLSTAKTAGEKDKVYFVPSEEPHNQIKQ